MLSHSNGDALRFNHVIITRDCRSVRRAIGLISAEAGPSGKRGTASHTENGLADLPAAGLLKFLPHNFSNSPKHNHSEAGIDPWRVVSAKSYVKSVRLNCFPTQPLGLSPKNLSVSEIVWSTDFAIWAILVRTTAGGSAKNPLKSIGLEISVLTSIHFCGTMVVMAVFLDNQ